MEGLKQKIESEITRKLGSDPSFRKALFEDPRKAIEQGLGIPIPAGSGVAVGIDTKGAISLTFSKGTEIGDELLEKVAGGCTGDDPWEDF